MNERMTAEEYRLAMKLLFRDSHAEAARMFGCSRQMSHLYWTGKSRIPNSVRNLIYIYDAIGIDRAKEILADTKLEYSVIWG